MNINPSLYSAREISAAIGITSKAVRKRLGTPDEYRDKMANYSESRMPKEWTDAVLNYRLEFVRQKHSVPTVNTRNAINPIWPVFAQVFQQAFTAYEAAVQSGEKPTEVRCHLLREAIASVRSQFPEYEGMDERTWRRKYNRWCELGRIPSALIDQKQGRSGRKSLWEKTLLSIKDQGLVKELVARYQALIEQKLPAVEAFRRMLEDPIFPADVRLQIKTPKSKSYMATSFRKVLAINPLRAAYRHSPKDARVEGAYVRRDWDALNSMTLWQADDMTVPVYWWVEDNTRLGYRIMQGQWLVMIDLGSQYILSHMLIARATGSYTSDDIFGLIGLSFKHGLPKWGFYFEGGAWQSKTVLGQKGSGTGLESSRRLGVLEDLGLKVKRAYTPNAKPIEGVFEHLQRLMQTVKGYRGRDPHHEKFQDLEKLVRQMQDGQTHPKDILLHQSELSDLLHEKVVNHWNHSRNDGEVCKGLSPWEAHQHKAPAEGVRYLPADAGYLYTTQVRREKVGPNGVRTQYCNKTFYYSGHDGRSWTNELLDYRGKEVLVWFTPEDIERAYITDLDRQFICQAKENGKVHPIHGDDALRDNMQRIRSQLGVIRRECKVTDPYITSKIQIPQADEHTRELNNQVQESRRLAKVERRVEQSKAEELRSNAEHLFKLLAEERGETSAVTDVSPVEHENPQERNHHVQHQDSRKSLSGSST